MSFLNVGENSWWRSALLALCCALLLSACGGRRSEQYRQEGEQYLALNKIEDAAESFAKALEANPGNARAKLGMGRALRVQGKPEEALAAYGDAIKLDPTLEEAYRDSVGLMLELDKKRTGEAQGRDWMAEAEALANRYQEVDPQAGALLLALIYVNTGREDQAITLLQEEKAKEPSSSQVRVALAKALMAGGKAAEAEAELRSLLDEKPQDEAPIRMALIDVFRAQGKSGEMIGELRDLVASQPQNLEVKLLLARSLLDSQEYDEAQAIAKEVLDKAPDHGWANFIVGKSLSAKGAYAEAVPYLDVAVQAMPGENEFQRELRLAKSGGVEAPEKAITEPIPTVSEPAAVASLPTQPLQPNEMTWGALWSGACLRSLVDQRQRFLGSGAPDPELRDAVFLAAIFCGQLPVADSMLQSMGDSPLAAYFIKLKERNVQGAIEALAPLKPEGSEAIQAMTEEQLKNLSEPVRKGIVIHKNALGYALSLGGARLAALTEFADAARVKPDNVVSLYNLAVMYRMAAMPEFAAGVLKKLLSLHPENLEARRMLYQVLVGHGKDQEARFVAESSYGLYPENREMILSLVDTYVTSGEAELAVRTLEQGIKSLPDDPQLLLAEVNVLLYGQQPKEAQAKLEALKLPAVFDGLRAQYLAFALAQQGDWDGVVRVLSSGDSQSLSAPARLLLVAALAHVNRAGDALAALTLANGAILHGPNAAILAEALGRATDATSEQKSLAEALQGAPTALASFAYAAACLESGYLNLAYETFGATVAAVGSHPQLLLIQLSTLSRLRAMPDRLEKAQAIVDNHADVAEAWVGLAMVKEELNDVEGARTALEKAVALNPRSTDVWYRRSVFGDTHKDYAMALEASRRLVELVPDNPSLNNNYAYYLLETNGDLQEALKQAEIAHAKLKDHPNILHTLGVAQLRIGQFEPALENLRKAVEMRPGDPTLLLDYGKVLIQMNHEEEGRKQVQSALQFSKQLEVDFPRSAEAEAIVSATPAQS